MVVTDKNEASALALEVHGELGKGRHVAAVTSILWLNFGCSDVPISQTGFWDHGVRPAVRFKGILTF